MNPAQGHVTNAQMLQKLKLDLQTIEKRMEVTRASIGMLTRAKDLAEDWIRTNGAIGEGPLHVLAMMTLGNTLTNLMQLQLAEAEGDVEIKNIKAGIERLESRVARPGFAGPAR